MGSRKALEQTLEAKEPPLDRRGAERAYVEQKIQKREDLTRRVQAGDVTLTEKDLEFLRLLEKEESGTRH